MTTVRRAVPECTKRRSTPRRNAAERNLSHLHGSGARTTSTTVDDAQAIAAMKAVAVDEGCAVVACGGGSGGAAVEEEGPLEAGQRVYIPTRHLYERLAARPWRSEALAAIAATAVFVALAWCRPTFATEGVEQSQGPAHCRAAATLCDGRRSLRTRVAPTDAAPAASVGVVLKVTRLAGVARHHRSHAHLQAVALESAVQFKLKVRADVRNHQR
eukprot:scaffold241_cov229-Prasinococcus_capsulatus_cf.AAC.10